MNLNDDDDDSERTELYTPPPMDFEHDEKENRFDSPSVIVLDESSGDQRETNNYFDQWPLVNDEIERLKVSSNQFSSAIIEEKETIPMIKRRRAPIKRKQKKKSMSEYRAPSPFSPKPDYKSMDVEQLKPLAMRYGLATNLSKGRLIKILDEIYNVTHQYETDSDFEWENNEEKVTPIVRTPPTPAVNPNVKKLKNRPAVHQMSSSSDDNDEHEGRFLELTVHELSSSSTTTDGTSTSPTKSQTKQKRPKLQTPTIPLKEILRNYIEANPTLHARILSYEPIDFEEFHKQMKNDLTMKIVSKELMQCLDDQCITFTLRSRKGAFTNVMRAKRRQK